MQTAHTWIHAPEGQAMQTLPRPKTLALLIGAALLSLALDNAYADSARGVDTVLGNALNPTAPNPPVQAGPGRPDPDGIGTHFPAAHTPTGQLYDVPQLTVDVPPRDDQWHTHGSAEIGVLGGGANENAALFRMYKDLDNGLYLNNFSLTAEKPDQARFVEASGGGVAHDDQFYSLQFGRYNDWKVKAFFNETPHVFTTTYRSLWSGVGTGNLTLNSLTPGGTGSAATTNTNLRAAALAAPESELSLVRKKGGVSFEMYLTPDWKVFASYSDEKREGARPFGMVMGGGGGTGGIELPESIDYDTHDLAAGVQYADDLTSFNLTASASLFRNNISSLNFENPMFLAAANGVSSFPTGSFDLYPDNDYFNLKGEYARALPDFYKGRFTAVVSASALRQNDQLQPYTSYPGVAVNSVAGGSWNTTAALSRDHADAKINTELVDLGLSVNPTDTLNVKGKVRYYATQNDTEYYACNPLTGQWGRLINDGSGSAMLATAAYQDPSVACNPAAIEALGIAPSAGNVNIRNIPYEYSQLNYSLAGDLRLGMKSNVNAAIEREEYHREHRERSRTWEDKIKLGYVTRAIDQATARISYEYARKRGNEYNPDPYEQFYSVSLGPEPTTGNMTSWIHVIDQFRKFDLADRDQGTLNARFNYMATETLDFGVSAQLRHTEYPDSDYGRRGNQNLQSLNFDVNYQPVAEFNVWGYYSHQNSTLHQRGISQNACAIGTTYSFWSNGVVNTGAAVPGAVLIGTTTVTAANWMDVCPTAGPTSPLYPESRAWSMDGRDRNDVVGIGIGYDFGTAKLDLGYTYSRGRNKTRYDYNAAALALTATQAANAGDGFSDMVLEQNILEASLRVPINKNATARFYYRYENGHIDDWHYEGVAANPVPGTNQQTYLDAGPEDYTANVFGVFVQMKF